MMQRASDGISKSSRGTAGERLCPGPDLLPQLQQAEQEVLSDAQDKGRTMLPITSHGKPAASLLLLFGGATGARRMTDQPTKQSRTEPWGECPGRPAGLLLLHVLHPPRYAGAGAAVVAAVVAAAGRARHRRLGRPSLLSIAHQTALLVSLDAQAARAAGVAACGAL